MSQTTRIYSNRLYLVQTETWIKFDDASRGFRPVLSIVRGDLIKSRGLRRYVVEELRFAPAEILESEVRIGDGHLPDYQPRMTAATFELRTDLQGFEAVFTQRSAR